VAHDRENDKPHQVESPISKTAVASGPLGLLGLGLCVGLLGGGGLDDESGMTGLGILVLFIALVAALAGLVQTRVPSPVDAQGQLIDPPPTRRPGRGFAIFGMVVVLVPLALGPLLIQLVFATRGTH
jgi:hypothetical protein